MHDELNAKNISKKMIKISSNFSPMNSSIPMKRKYNSSSHHYRPRFKSVIMSNESMPNSVEYDDEEDDYSRDSNMITVENDILKTKSSMTNNFPLPSPPSSTRSSFDASSRDLFLSNGDIDNCDSQPSIEDCSMNESNTNEEFENDTAVNNINGENSDLCIESKNEENFDDDIKLIFEKLIEDVVVNLSIEEKWDSVKIDLDGETVLPNGIRLIKGIADMPFNREFDDQPPRFTNQLNWLKNMLTRFVCRYKTAMPFLHPVDSVFLKIPHYYLVVRQPMDLTTVRNRINFLWYRSANECISDIRQIFKNCYHFNSPNNYVYKAGKKLEECFEEKLKEMPSKELEIPCPPKQNFDEVNKKNIKRRSASISDRSLDQSNTPNGEPGTPNSSGSTVSSSPLMPDKMMTRRERGIMVRKPSKDLPSSSVQPREKKVPLNKAMRECLNFVKELFHKKHQSYAWPFYNPVDTKQYPDYLEKIKKPIDLTTITENIKTGKYSTVKDFARDMRLMFSNCLRYNSPDSPIIEQARKLREAFECRYARFPESYFNETLMIKNSPCGASTSTAVNSSPASTSQRHHITSKIHNHYQTYKKSKSNDKKNQHKNHKSDSANLFKEQGMQKHTNGNQTQDPNVQLLQMKVKLMNDIITMIDKKALSNDVLKNILKFVDSNSLDDKTPINLKNGTSKQSSRKNGYKSKKQTKKTFTKTPRKKRKNLSSDEDSDANNRANHLESYAEKFDPENIDDLKTLKNDLENLHASDLQNVLRILHQSEPSLQCDDEQNVEIDFEALKPKTLKNLRNYVSSCMLNSKNSSYLSLNHQSNSSKLNNSFNSKNIKKCHGTANSVRRGVSDFDTDCDKKNNNFGPRADSRALDLQLSEESSSGDSEFSSSDSEQD